MELLLDDELGSRREKICDPLPEDYQRAFDAIERDPGQLLVVGELGDDVVATLQLSFIPSLTHQGSWRAQIEGVRVASSQRGSGLGAELIRWAIDRAAERGCRIVQLTSDRRRPEAIRFYEGLGFRSTHEGMKLVLS